MAPLLRAFWNRPREERRLLATAVARLLLADLALRLGWRGWRSGAGPDGARGTGGSIDPDRVVRLRAIVDAAANRNLYEIPCLPRAIVLRSLLAREGVSSRVEFGVRREEGELRAHAWLDVEEGDERFVPLR